MFLFHWKCSIYSASSTSYLKGRDFWFRGKSTASSDLNSFRDNLSLKFSATQTLLVVLFGASFLQVLLRICLCLQLGQLLRRSWIRFQYQSRISKYSLFELKTNSCSPRFCGYFFIIGWLISNNFSNYVCEFFHIPMIIAPAISFNFAVSFT